MTNIAFTLGQSGPVQISIFDLHGRKIKDLVDGRLAAGDHEYAWRGLDSDGQRVASGTYFCRVVLDSGSRTMKLTLLE